MCDLKKTWPVFHTPQILLKKNAILTCAKKSLRQA
jgi:hypothetical protein